ncbi:sensor histidine kinase [Labilibacter marinus]|uniref:sensor histidine kinase n=1 Tax=Labilibacter marinus TaxID=1477105 RepID=UPI000834AF63|nr:ATP-binding protein [Labilibacter marinus]
MIKLLPKIFILLFFTSGLHAQKEVKVGAFSLYPAIFMDDDGEVKGFYVDALCEIEKKENIKFKYICSSWEDGLAKIKAGKIDLMTSVAYSDERNEYMDYGLTPLLTVWGEVYVDPDSDIDGILNLAGKKIAVMKKDMNARHLKELTKKLSVQCSFIEVDEFEEVFQLVSKGIVDAGVVNNTFGAGKYMEHGLRSTGIVLNPFDIFFTVKKNENAELLDLLDNYLVKWKRDSKSVFNVSRQKWSHGNVGSIQVVPRYVKDSLYVVAVAVLSLMVFVFLLRYRIRVATQKVKRSEAVFKTFMENIGAFVYIKDKDSKHIYKNKKVNELKFDDQTLYGSESPIFDEETIELIKDSDNKILSGEAKQLQLIYTAKVGGKKVWLHALKFLLQVPGEEPRIGGFSFDITKLKETEQELIAAKEKAEEGGRLKTAFLNNLSHEIRTPLNAIVGFSELLSSEESTGHEIDYISVIRSSSNQLLSILTDVLTISQLETEQANVRTDKINVNQIIDRLILMFNKDETTSKLQVRAGVKLNDYEANVYSDQTKLIQILTNLISNGVKFTSKGFVEINCERKSEMLVFCVKDSGIGIDPKFHRLVFERFRQVDFSTNKEYGGTGLGLSISKGFIELLGGKIWIESRKGEGAKFYFTIPYKPAFNEINV